MAHINEMYESQAKQLLHKLCDALGIEQQDRTKSGVEKAIDKLGLLYDGSSAKYGGDLWPDDLLDDAGTATAKSIVSQSAIDNIKQRDAHKNCAELVSMVRS